MNYQDESGDWVPIVNDFVAAPGATFDVQNAANDYTAQIPIDPAQDPIKFTSDDGWVSMRMHGLDGAADVDGSEVTFESVTKADEVTYEAT
ncbi:MAG: hypothetical protein M3467_00080, partial [Actinomycetota bacterium]|nr:hypothetical protein [Actinomycetota bacterium]